MDQLKLFQKTKMKDQIKTAEAMSAVEEARVAAELDIGHGARTINPNAQRSI